ncbi:THO complex subunit 2, partial [Quaeritorhiza haematococci]
QFLADNLAILTAWHKDKEAYAREGKGNGLPGFQRRWPPGPLSVSKIPDADLLDWEDFRRVMYKWHGKLRLAFITCLESGEYMQMRNAILVLDRIRDYFPLIIPSGESIERVVKSIEEKEERGDLKQLARSYYAKMKSLKGNWIPVHSFSKQNRPPSVHTASGSGSNKENSASGNAGGSSSKTSKTSSSGSAVGVGLNSSPKSAVTHGDARFPTPHASASSLAAAAAAAAASTASSSSKSGGAAGASGSSNSSSANNNSGGSNNPSMTRSESLASSSARSSSRDRRDSDRASPPGA